LLSNDDKEFNDADLLQAIEATICKTRYYRLLDILH